MGINGLLPVIKPICKQQHVQEFANSRVGIDAYAWLHKGAFSCASKICTGVETRAYVEYCMHRVRMLMHFQAQPVVVFDGAELPMKAGTHAERRERRKEALRRAEQAAAAGDSRKAEEWYQRACFVTSDMARNVIRECRKLNVEYVVAPYEADAQLAWMMQTGYIASVITEDSDLLVYGASKVFYKMSKDGMGDMYESKHLPSLETISMANFTEDMFMYMCVCSGCDFFKGVQGLGIKKAHALTKRYKTLPRVLQAIRREPRYRVSPTFTIDFTRACMVFRHQTVYDMNKKIHIHLRDVNALTISKLPHGVLQKMEGGAFDLSFLGEHRDPDIARKVAEGFVHPRTLKEYEEPLDIIDRPVMTKRRPRHFPNPPSKQRRLTPEPPRKVRGFQVQPSSSRLQTPLVGARRLVDRSLARPISFNPKLIGVSLKAQTKAGHSTCGVWSSFRPSSRLENKTPRPRREHDGVQNKEAENKAAVGDSASILKEEDFVKVHEDRNETHLSPSMSLTLEIESQPETTEMPVGFSDVDLSERPRSSSRRVEAVHRALGKFARTKERDVREKFKPEKKRSLPPSCPSTPPKQSSSILSPSTDLPSPDIDTTRQHALVKTSAGPGQGQKIVASDDRNVTPKSSLQRRKSNQTPLKPLKSSKSSTGRQLRLSRFFKPVSLSKEAKDIAPINTIEKMLKSADAVPRKKSSPCSKININEMDNFMRRSNRD